MKWYRRYEGIVKENLNFCFAVTCTVTVIYKKKLFFPLKIDSFKRSNQKM